MYSNDRKTRSYFYVLLIFTLFMSCQSSTSSTENKEVKMDLELLLGKWQSVENPKTIIEMTKNRIYGYYDGLKLSDESLMIYQDCVSKCVPAGMTPMPCLVTDGKRAEHCFEVLELTKEKLSYTLVGKEGKILSFKKM